MDFFPDWSCSPSKDWVRSLLFKRRSAKTEHLDVPLQGGFLHCLSHVSIPNSFIERGLSSS